MMTGVMIVRTQCQAGLTNPPLTPLLSPLSSSAKFDVLFVFVLVRKCAARQECVCWTFLLTSRTDQ